MDDGGRNRLAVWFLGRTGSGKTSLAMILERQLGFRLLSGGNLLRRLAAAKRKPYAPEARKALKKGGTLSDDFILQIYDEELRKSGSARTCLDGNPRNLDHFKAVCLLLARHGYDDDHLLCFHLEIDRTGAGHRLSMRRMCPSCKTQTALPSCPKCKTETLRRADDADPTVLLEKNRWFEEDVWPVITWLESRRSVITIEASKGAVETSGQVVRVVEQRFKYLASLN